MWLLIWHTVVWSLWEHRNGIILSNGNYDFMSLLDRIKYTSWKWFLAKSRSWSISTLWLVHYPKGLHKRLWFMKLLDVKLHDFFHSNWMVFWLALFQVIAVYVGDCYFLSNVFLTLMIWSFHWLGKLLVYCSLLMLLTRPIGMDEVSCYGLIFGGLFWNYMEFAQSCDSDFRSG